MMWETKLYRNNIGTLYLCTSINKHGKGSKIGLSHVRSSVRAQ